MIELNNYISKLLYKDNNNTYSILSYIDLDEALTNEFILNYVNEIIIRNPMLKKMFIEKDDKLFVEDETNFNIEDYYKIEKTRSENFDDYIYNILNSKFDKNIKWNFLWLIDDNNKKSRVYFKIHHSYVDRKKLISILISPFKNNDSSKKFKRKTSFLNTLYYYFIGTILLIIANIKIIINIFIKTIYKIDNNDLSEENTKTDTDYIIFKSLDLNKIKQFTKYNNITINDFLYSLMIKTDKIYRKNEKILTTFSPCYIPSNSETINVCPIFNEINNSYDNLTLLKKVNENFNNFKYSLFIPLLTFILNQVTSYLNINTLNFFYKSFINNIDYAITNIIGPSIEELNQQFKIKITDMRFLIVSKSNEIIYNMVSSGENINIVCSFKKGIVKNKTKFEKSLYKAYHKLINYE